MNNSKKSRLDELKIKACILLKNVRSTDSEKSIKAAQRFAKLPFLASKTPEEIIADNDLLKLKHALLAVAHENACDNWTALREKVIQEDCLYPPNGGVFLNNWYASYEAAKKHQATHGGYLLQYRKDYFVCEEPFIENLGLSSLKKEWEAIEKDWTKRDNPNWTTIYLQAKHNYLNRPQHFDKPDKSKRPEWIKA